jgi:glycosyltransferase involved in cell wall biosynthesis
VRVLYLSYTGLLEPLGQSQVLAYLTLLSREHRITLVTFEKAADFADGAAMAAQRQACDALGIRWLPRRYHHRPRLLATAWDLLVFTLTALRESGRADLIHARSYIPSFVALAVKTLRGTPFIFDMRALWPDEMAVAGRLEPRSPMFRLLKWGEKRCLFGAGAVVSLTEAAVPYLRAQYGEPAERINFIVVPTCVDLDRFKPGTGAAAPDGSLTVVASLGTVLSGWFWLPWLAAFFRALDVSHPDTRMAVITPEDETAIRDALADNQAPVDRVAIFGVPSARVPEELIRLSAVAMFMETSIAKLGSCPTRMGEVLACGLPVVANPGIGDVAEIIRRYQVGLLVEDASDEAMAAAVEALAVLLRDPALSARCRAAAEDWFSLRKGADAYDRLYWELGAGDGLRHPDREGTQ